VKPWQIEFGNVGQRVPWWSLLLFVLALLVAVSGMWRYSAVRMQFAQTAVPTPRNEPVRLPLVAESGVTTRPVVFETEIKPLRLAIAQLNVPWSALFQRLEAQARGDVALLSLESDNGGPRLRLIGEASSASAMVAYANRLAAPSVFGTGVSIVRHESIGSSATPVVRFELVLPWTSPR